MKASNMAVRCIMRERMRGSLQNLFVTRQDGQAPLVVYSQHTHQDDGDNAQQGVDLQRESQAMASRIDQSTRHAGQGIYLLAEDEGHRLPHL